MTTNLPTTQTRSTAVGFSTAESFELMQRVAGAFSSSDLVPEAFKGKIGNCVIGVELAQRIGASPLMVMQNLNVIHGRPAFSSKFIISAINTCGKFSPLRFKIEKLGKKKVSYSYWVGSKQQGNREQKSATVEIDDIICTAYATELATGEILEGPAVSIETAVLEGWYTKNDSKWKTMPDLMLRYRAASFFGNLYAPEILMGMQTVEEVQDVIDVTPVRVDEPATKAVAADLNDAIKKTSSLKRKAKVSSQSLDVESIAETNEEIPAETTTEKRETTDNQVDDGGLWDD
jgi:hypothetical protein